jgi:hypothetical protein
VSPFVGGGQHPQSAERSAAMAAMMKNRNEKRGNERFVAERTDGKGGVR